MVKTVSFQVSDEEYKQIEEEARKKNMTVTQFVKAIVLAYVKAKKTGAKTEEKDLKKEVEELKKTVEELKKRVSEIEQAFNKLGDELEKAAKKAGLI